MTENPNRENVVSYYDEHVKNKLNDFIVVNPRIEFGWETIKRFTPSKPAHFRSRLRYGKYCSRMRKYWPDAVITGIDISTMSIQIAQKLFGDNNLEF
jgi:hypothetical protein